jgi:hypothetical protein
MLIKDSMFRQKGAQMKGLLDHVDYSSSEMEYLRFTGRDDRVQNYRRFSDHLNYIRCIELLHRPNRWGTKA